MPFAAPTLSPVWLLWRYAAFNVVPRIRRFGAVHRQSGVCPVDRLGRFGVVGRLGCFIRFGVQHRLRGLRRFVDVVVVSGFGDERPQSRWDAVAPPQSALGPGSRCRDCCGKSGRRGGCHACGQICAAGRHRLTGAPPATRRRRRSLQTRPVPTLAGNPQFFQQAHTEAPAVSHSSRIRE